MHKELERVARCLQSQPAFELLCVLVEHIDQYLTKAEMMKLTGLTARRIQTSLSILRTHVTFETKIVTPQQRERIHAFRIKEVK